MQLDFDVLKSETIEQIDKNKLMVFATSTGDRVTARMMSVINHGLNIYFQTSVNSTKYQQLIKNPHVALCIGNMQIEGTAKIMGHPTEVPYFADNYPKSHLNSFKTYSSLSCSRVVEVQPTSVTYWKYDEQGQPYRDFLDLLNEKAWRELYLENP